MQYSWTLWIRHLLDISHIPLRFKILITSNTVVDIITHIASHLHSSPAHRPHHMNGMTIWSAHQSITLSSSYSSPTLNHSQSPASSISSLTLLYVLFFILTFNDLLQSFYYLSPAILQQTFTWSPQAVVLPSPDCPFKNCCQEDLSELWLTPPKQKLQHSTAFDYFQDKVQIP